MVVKMSSRIAVTVSGSAAKVASCSSVNGGSSFGETQFADRW